MREGTEFTPLPARVHVGREGFEQDPVERASGKRAIELVGTDARDRGSKAAGDHFAGQAIGRLLPQRKHRFQTGSCEAFFAVTADILEEEIPEGDMGEPGGYGSGDRPTHTLLIDFVGTRVGQGN
jgi:hypothetical protein